jgi:hypothetical protein
MTVAHANTARPIQQPQPIQPIPALEQLAELVAKHGEPTNEKDEMSLAVEIPTKTSVGTVIPGCHDRFLFHTDGWNVWVTDVASARTYSASAMDGIRWLRVLKEVLA